MSRYGDPMKRIAIAATAAALLTLTACAGADEAEPEPETTTETIEETAEVGVTEEPAEDAPAPLGEPVTVGDWEITINSWNPNADEEVFVASGETDVPNEDMHFAILNVTMKFVGEGTGDIDTVSIDYIPDGPGSVSSLWTTFGTTPGENKLAYTTLTNGGEVTGDALYEITADSEGTFQVYAGDPADAVLVATE